MVFWRDEAKKFGEALQTAVVRIDDPPTMHEAIRLRQQMLEARQRAQDCAVDLAPYVHARLAAVTVNPTASRTITPEEIPNDPVAAAQVYRRLICGGT